MNQSSSFMMSYKVTVVPGFPPVGSSHSLHPTWPVPHPPMLVPLQCPCHSVSFLSQAHTNIQVSVTWHETTILHNKTYNTPIQEPLKWPSIQAISFILPHFPVIHIWINTFLITKILLITILPLLRYMFVLQAVERSPVYEYVVVLLDMVSPHEPHQQQRVSSRP